MYMNTKYFDTQDLFLDSINDKDLKYLLFFTSLTPISIEEFNKKNVQVSGAIFSHIIYKDKLYEKGLISIEISENFDFEFIDNINEYKFENKDFSNSKSIITILDGFSKYNEEFLVKLFENLTINTNIIGGGAGSLDDISRAVIFNNDGFSFNSALLLSLKNKKINISSKHGWEYLSGPYIATSSKKNLLETIDYIDAFEHYKNVIKNDCDIEITKDNFLEISRIYPIGIAHYKAEDIVRDPISFENGKLILVSEIRENSIINILKGDKTKLLKAAEEAAKIAIDENCELAIVFNCITRKNFLGDNFKDELTLIFNEISTSRMIGFITVGEIANNGNRYISLLNKTCVIGGI
jgi:hypothetical protein